MQYCLETAGIKLADVDYVVFYDKPFLKFERLLETYLAFAPRGFTSFRKAMPLWLKEKLLPEDAAARRDEALAARASTGRTLLFTEHHHEPRRLAPSIPSPFEEAAVLTHGRRRRMGDHVARRRASGNELEMLREIHFPHSLGLLYSAFTYYTGFKVNSGEYKVMGLAPYGEPDVQGH